MTKSRVPSGCLRTTSVLPPPSGEFSSRSRWRLDHPVPAQHRQTLLRYNNSTRFKAHPTALRKKVPERVPYVLAADHFLAVDYANRVEFIQSDQP